MSAAVPPLGLTELLRILKAAFGESALVNGVEVSGLSDLEIAALAKDMMTKGPQEGGPTYWEKAVAYVNDPKTAAVAPRARMVGIEWSGFGDVAAVGSVDFAELTKQIVEKSNGEAIDIGHTAFGTNSESPDRSTLNTEFQSYFKNYHRADESIFPVRLNSGDYFIYGTGSARFAQDLAAGALRIINFARNARAFSINTLVEMSVFAASNPNIQINNVAAGSANVLATRAANQAPNGEATQVENTKFGKRKW